MSITDWLRVQCARIQGSFRRRIFDHELDEELDNHLALLAERARRQGMGEQEAWREARRQFGSVSARKEQLRDRSRFRPFEAILKDSAYLLRQYRKAPLFALAVIGIIALGIGANTAMFTLAEQIILRALPIADADRIVLVASNGRFYGDNMGHHTLSYPMYEALRNGSSKVFSSIACSRVADFTVVADGKGEPVSGELVSGNYFRLLGIRSTAGRLFTASDDLYAREHRVAVLAYSYWVSRFGGDHGVIGRTVMVNNQPLVIVGVGQREFSGLDQGIARQIFLPVTMTPALFPNDDIGNLYNPRLRWLRVYGRLKPGATTAFSRAQLLPVFEQQLKKETLEPGFVHANANDRRDFLRMQLVVEPGSQGNGTLREKYEKPLRLLMGVTGFVLLIACANLASLLAARALGRGKEIAMRMALGAGRTRVIQQLMTESLLLALIGGTVGVVLSISLSQVLFAFLPPNRTGYDMSAYPNGSVLAFSAILTALTGMLFGLLPAREAARSDVVIVLKEQAAHATGKKHVMMRRLLVTGQIALALVLSVGAGLFARSLAHLRAEDTGFSTDNVLQFQIPLDGIGYDQKRAYAFFTQLERELNSLPGVESAGIATDPVLGGSHWESLIITPGRTRQSGDLAHVNSTTGGFFRALGMHLMAGRFFQDSDRDGFPHVAIVSQSFARYFFGSGQAVGRRVGRGYDTREAADMEIVGVVNNARTETLQEDAPRQIYLCFQQNYPFWGTVYVHVRGNTQRIMIQARKIVHKIEPLAPVVDVKTVAQHMNESLATERLMTLLSTAFSAIAITLSVLGLYGVMSYTLNHRGREIAIRIALGAKASNVRWMVMREVMATIGMGIVLAFPLAFALSGLVRSQLYGVAPGDPAAIALSIGILSVATLLAGWIPVRRATFVDPSRVLRQE